MHMCITEQLCMQREHEENVLFCNQVFRIFSYSGTIS